MPPNFSAEQDCLFERAAFTWFRRAAAQAAKMPFGEETVTETILLDLKLYYPGSLTIIPFNKRQEAKIGADWEWCFASQTHQYFQTMHVQAKVLDDLEANYPHIDRQIGHSGVRQIDKLIDSAGQRGIPAIYAFYNHISAVPRLPSNCPTIGNSHPNPLPPCWGISVADANAVRAILPDKAFDTLCQASIPLHCLLCTGHGTFPGSGTPGALIMALDRLEAGNISGWDAEPREPRMPSMRAPAYFEDALRLQQPHSPEEDIAIRDKLAATNPDIDGIVVFIDSHQKDATDKTVKPKRRKN